ncbi:NADP-dependent oxidoreductase [Nocardiopsis coralliicola]
MRAIAISGFGADPESMELPDPEPGPGMFLVRLRAAGVNPFDLKVAGGALRDVVPHRFPLILGNDGAGEVAAVGSGVTAFRPGDAVFGQFMNLPLGLGSYAEYALATEEDAVAPVPDGMSFALAAAVPTASMAAFAVVDAAAVGAGRTVLVVGATGGVGQSAVQFAADRGADVIATAATEDDAELLESLGAAATVDHTTGRLPAQVAGLRPDGVHAVLDLVDDAAGVAPLLPLLRGGDAVAVSTTGALDPEALSHRGIRAENVRSRGSSALLATLADMVAAGRLHLTLDHEAPLTGGPAALARLAEAHTRGKTVLHI